MQALTTRSSENSSSKRFTNKAIGNENRIAKLFSDDLPLGFAAGDTNLSRYVGNSPTNGIDPTGLFVVFPTAGGANDFVAELKKLGAKHTSTIVGKAGAYVIIDPRDRGAVFGYADSRSGPLFGKRDFSLDSTLLEMAKARNNFLMAAGVAGLDEQNWSDVDGDRIPVSKQDLLNVQQEVAKRKAMKECNPPLHIDIGGEGGHPDALNVNIAGRRGGKSIPNLIARLGPDAPLPFSNGSVDRITMENTPVSNVTAAEIARLIKIGGTIFILTTVDGRKDHDRVIAAIGGRGSIDQAISNNVLTTTIRIR